MSSVTSTSESTFRGALRRSARRFLVVFGLMLATTSVTAAGIDGCRAVDVTGNGVVDLEDVERTADAVGTMAGREDLDGDGAVTEIDVLLVRTYLPPCDLQGECGGTLCGGGCPGDFDASGTVDGEDEAILLQTLGDTCRFDLNRDGMICPRDQAVLAAYKAAFEEDGGDTLSLAAMRADFTGDGQIDAADAEALRRFLRATPDRVDKTCVRDLNRDGRIDVHDRLDLLDRLGPCPEARAATREPKPDVCGSKDLGWDTLVHAVPFVRP